jgi:hypothetical protein
MQVGPAGGLIGRSRKCTISLLHDCEVSHNHALLELFHGHLCIRDVGSTFGTYLNDKRLSEPKRASEAHKLKPCDAIKVGQTSLRWRPLPVIRATLAVSVPASVRLLAEQCAALCEPVTVGDVSRAQGAAAHRAPVWPGTAGIPAAASPSSSAAASSAAAAALEQFSRSSLPPSAAEAIGGSVHPSLRTAPSLNSALSLGSTPSLEFTGGFETVRAAGALATAAAPAGATEDGGGGGGSGPEFFHRTGADETHHVLLLVLRTLYLRVRPAAIPRAVCTAARCPVPVPVRRP